MTILGRYDVEELLGRPLTQAESIALDGLIELAYGDLELMLGRSIAVAEHEDEVVAQYSYVPLPHSPVRSVSAVEVEGAIVSAGLWEIERSGVVIPSVQAGEMVSVTYEAGLGEPFESRSRMCVFGRVSRTLAKIHDDALGVSSLSQEGYNAAYLAEGWSEQERLLLDRARKRLVLS